MWTTLNQAFAKVLCVLAKIKVLVNPVAEPIGDEGWYGFNPRLFRVLVERRLCGKRR